ncbi:hypothetical protein PRZ48_011421 [Zasmidium cellare]|uniref:Uncharacterized protein n=1 Tax=Zasmidium cellare TaxID=395010 RepID=A0ABR0E6C6_ZASCE|nr:hypothetical protein PRZ48_011421 [Zasmidium cellare]
MEEAAAQPAIIEPPPGVQRAYCNHCDKQYLSIEIQQAGEATYKESFPDDEAKQFIDGYTEQLVQIQQDLQEGLSQYGDVLLSRWAKNSKEKCRQILCSTSLMSSWETQCVPEANIWVRDHGKVLSCARWLSVKPFMEDRTRLLSLLHLRSSRHPSEFALLDCKEVHRTWGRMGPGRLRHFYNSKSMVICGPEYGKLVEWDRQLAHTWATVRFPRALMMLQAQLYIMQFCLEMLDKITNEAEPSGNEKWLQQVAAGFKTPGSETIWSNYTNPAFAPPVVFDPDWLLKKANSRLRFALDEMWLMQTDPAYMHFVIQRQKANTIYDPKASPSASMRWSNLTRDFVDEMYHRVGFWHVIVIACQNVCDVLKVTGFQRGQRVAEEADGHMWQLLQELHGRIRLLGENLKRLLPTMSALKARPGTYQLALTFDMLERELESESSARCVDNRLLAYLSDMAAMDEMFGLVYYNQIGSAKMPAEVDMSFEEHHKHHVNVYKQSSIMMYQLKAFYEASWPRGKHDLAWLEKANNSRRKLAAFWECYRNEYRIGEGKSGMDMKRSSMDMIEFDIEPEFLAVLEAERRRCEAQSAADTLIAAAKAEKALASLKIEDCTWGTSSDDASPVRRKKTKAKAEREERKFSTDNTAETAASSSPEDIDAQLSPIPVKQDSFVVFQKMYSHVGSETGSARWQQFVQAMVDAGFSATATGGSAVSFSIDKGSIAIHKPHPEPVIESVPLQGIGRRMKKSFGWSLERFVVWQKEVVDE